VWSAAATTDDGHTGQIQNAMVRGRLQSTKRLLSQASSGKAEHRESHHPYSCQVDMGATARDASTRTLGLDEPAAVKGRRKPSQSSPSRHISVAN
jgi:hypothetical protein